MILQSARRSVLRAWKVSQAVVDSLPGPPHEIVNVDLVAEDGVDLPHWPALEQDCVAIVCAADANLDCFFHLVAAFVDGLAKIPAEIRTAGRGSTLVMLTEPPRHSGGSANACSRDSDYPDGKPPAASPKWVVRAPSPEPAWKQGQGGTPREAVQRQTKYWGPDQDTITAGR